MHINRRRMLLLLIDIMIFVSIFAFFANFIVIGTENQDFSQMQAVKLCLVLLSCVFGVRLLTGIYGRIWRYANVRDYLNLILADFFGGAFYLAIDRAVFTSNHLMSAAAIAIVCSVLVASLAARFIYQRLRYYYNKRNNQGDANKVSVLIIGAGTLGVALVQELQSNPKGRYQVFAFIDNNKSKIGSKVCGLPVYGEEADLVAQVKAMPVQDVIIAIDSLTPQNLQELYNRYQKTGCKVKVYAHPLDSVDLAQGKLKVREIRIEDLLYREQVSLSNAQIKPFYKDKTVLVTGGGGSIGSELCRHLAKMQPRRLVLLNIYENNAYDIQQELVRSYGNALDVCIEIGSIRDAQKVEQVFRHYQPDIVFHAAAHKHVPLMEHNCEEAVKNNVFGTYNVVQAAERAGVDRFIMISTDKAVNPTSMMGATKRLCEMIIQSKSASKTRFAAVRFGNVLGSNGSVIPLFKRQIELGGPVTLTDKRIIRYFMTIPEAAQLVLETGLMALNNEIFVLDMGMPVKILDLAENMIKLAGMLPGKDIQIQEVGLRPGEKLYEELLMKTESLDKTGNDKIFIERDKPNSAQELEDKLALLRAALESGETEEIRRVMKVVVPTYVDAEQANLAEDFVKVYHLQKRENLSEQVS